MGLFVARIARKPLSHKGLPFDPPEEIPVEKGVFPRIFLAPARSARPVWRQLSRTTNY